MAIVPTSRQRVGPPASSGGGLAMYPVGQEYKAAGQVFSAGADFLSKIAKAEDLGNLADSISKSQETIINALYELQTEMDPEKRAFGFDEAVDSVQQNRPDDYFMGKEFDRQISVFKPGWRYHFNSLDAQMKIQAAKGKFQGLISEALTIPDAANSQAEYDAAGRMGWAAGLFKSQEDYNQYLKDFESARTIFNAESSYDKLTKDFKAYLDGGAIKSDLPDAMSDKLDAIITDLVATPRDLSDEQEAKRDSLVSDAKSLRAGMANKIKAAAEAREDAVSRDLMGKMVQDKVIEPRPYTNAYIAGLISLERRNQFDAIYKSGFAEKTDPAANYEIDVAINSLLIGRDGVSRKNVADLVHKNAAEHKISKDDTAKAFARLAADPDAVGARNMRSAGRVLGDIMFAGKSGAFSFSPDGSIAFGGSATKEDKRAYYAAYETLNGEHQKSIELDKQMTESDLWKRAVELALEASKQSPSNVEKFEAIEKNRPAPKPSLWRSIIGGGPSEVKKTGTSGTPKKLDPLIFKDYLTKELNGKRWTPLSVADKALYRQKALDKAKADGYEE